MLTNVGSDLRMAGFFVFFFAEICIFLGQESKKKSSNATKSISNTFDLCLILFGATEKEFSGFLACLRRKPQRLDGV